MSSLADLVADARRLVVPGERRILGITGPPGGGKSTLAALLVDALGDSAALVGMDGFHLANTELIRLGRRDRKGAIDTFDVGGYVALLGRLRGDEAVVYAPDFDRTLEESIGGSVAVAREVPLVVTEGNYLLVPDGGWGAVRPLLDACWYVDCDESVRIERLIQRHCAYGKTPVEARAWALGSDAHNAAIVAATRAAATRIVALDSP